EKSKCRAVKRIRSALADYRQQRAARTPVCGGEALSGKREFLYAFHREALKYAADGVVFVVAAVNRDVEVAARGAAYRECSNARFCRVEGRLKRRARKQHRKRGERAAIDRQTFQLPLVDD